MPIPDDAALDRSFPVIVEIPKGSKNKYVFEDYKVLEGKPVAVGADLSREQAIEVLRAAARRYREHHP